MLAVLRRGDVASWQGCMAPPSTRSPRFCSTRVRLNAGVGVGGAGTMTGGPAARVGLDGEYWLS
ncbi:MAG TPA: hypothetical protein VGY54_08735 [Polyangiaceae bacterium]|nr:hypothetical protein [Polyangiaceae bacterium]